MNYPVAVRVLALLPASFSAKILCLIFIELSLMILHCILIFFTGPFFPAMMQSAVLHQGRVPAGQLCDLQSGLMHVSSQMAIYGQSMVVVDATALR